MANLEKIIKVTQEQYDVLASGGKVGDYVGLQDNYIYMVEDKETKTTVISDASTDNQYPSAKAVYDFVKGECKLIETTWAELKNLRDSSQLIPGRFYRITDYKCTTAQENTQSAGHQFDVIVTADDERTLNENARAAVHEGDEYFQEIISDTKVVSAKWKAGVTLSSITEKYKMSDDDWAYPAPVYEDKEFTEMRTMINKDGVEVPCLLNPDPAASGQDDYLVYCGVYKWKKIADANPLLAVYYTIYEDGSQEYVGQGSTHQDDIFVEIAYKDIGGVSTPVLYKEDLNIYINDNASVDYGDEFRYLGDFAVDGVTYNRWAKYDDSTNGTHQILTDRIVVNNRFTVSPEEFRAAVRETTVVYDKWQECDSTGEPRSQAIYLLTNNLVDAEIEDPGPLFKPLANLSAWEIKYCLDNDADRFAWAKGDRVFTDDGLWFTRSGTAIINGQIYYLWYNSNFENGHYLGSTKDKLKPRDLLDKISADKQSVVAADYSTIENIEAGGKGVIYYMKDEWNNEAPYDFKNILYTQITSKDVSAPQCSYYYTFNYCDARADYPRPVDLSVIRAFNPYNNKEIGCHGNIIKPYRDQTNNEDSGYGFKQYLNKIVFQNYCLDSGEGMSTFCCYSNTFDFGCRNITFGKCSSMNAFGKDCRNIFTGYNFNYNKLGNDCFDNTFGNNCYRNAIGNTCFSNAFGNGCNDNTLGDYCYSNTFGYNCEHNKFSVRCSSNSFGSSCDSNTFGNYCTSNTFSTSCADNTFGYNCSRNVFRTGCSDNTFGNYCNANAFDDLCTYNAFGSYCQYNNFIEDYTKFNELKDGVSYILLTSTSPNAAASDNCLQNIVINHGVKGKNQNNKRKITIDRNLSYSTTILAPGSREIVLDEGE